MAGHSQFKNIMHRKGAQDARRAKQFTKLVREITVSAKTGQADPEFNPRLRNAIANAREANLPKDRIDAAVTKGASPHVGENFEEVRYECYAHGGVALIIEVLTDNRNRASSDIKSTIVKHGCTVAEPGSVVFLFDRVGLVEFDASKITSEQMLEASIEGGADECESDESSHTVFCKIDHLHNLRDFLTNKFGEPKLTKLFWKPKSVIEITDMEEAKSLMKLLEALDDLDDVQSVSGNYTISAAILDKI